MDIFFAYSCFDPCGYFSVSVMEETHMKLVPEWLEDDITNIRDKIWEPTHEMYKRIRASDSSSKPWPWVLTILLCFVVLFSTLGVCLYGWKQPDHWYSLFNYKIFYVFVLLSFLIPLLIIAACWYSFDRRFGKIQTMQNHIRQCTEKYRLVISDLKRQIAESRSQTITAPASGIETSLGLEQFSYWIVDAINNKTTHVHLAINTPLLHSFYWEGSANSCIMPYVRKPKPKHGEKATHWTELFCGPLATALQGNTDIDFLFLHLYSDWLKQTTKWFPFIKRSDFNCYEKEVKNFKQDIISILGREEDQPFQETDMLPFWLAIIRGKNGESNFGQVILGLTSREDLEKSIRVKNGKVVDFMDMADKKDFAQDVANEVVVLRSDDIKIVDFFDEVFRGLTLRNYNVVNVLRALLREGEHQELDVMFHADYDVHKHGHLKPDKIKGVLYSHKKIEG